MKHCTIGTLAAALLAMIGLTGCGSLWNRDEPAADWSRQLRTDPDYFPLAVWMQSPQKAERFADMGINLYINLWEGPTDEQLAQLADAGMPVFCEMEFDARKNIDNPIIVGWLHIDEPDNAQDISAAGQPKQYGPPVRPEKVVAHYRELKRIDPTRPVMLNLGQGVAWDVWTGRGERTNHPEDYAAYLQGCDMASFDIYPVVASHADIAGNLWYVPYGTARLKEWSHGKRMVWCAIEASRIGNLSVKPTPEQIRSEVWMAIIHGARGIVYFVHQFQPTFHASPILDDPDMFEGVRALNEEIHALAPVINAPQPPQPPRVSSSVEEVPIATMLRRDGDTAYLFAAAIRDGRTTGTFTVPQVDEGATVEVIGENRSLTIAGGGFSDDFAGYQVHLYRID